MDPQQMIQVIEQQKKTPEAARHRKGQRATQKASRHFLLSLLNSMGLIQTANHRIRQCFLGFAYPPSQTLAASLSPITLSELRLETVHTGKVLLLRTIGQPKCLTAVHNVVEDTSGQAERLAIYNIPENASPNQILPKGTVYAVKEPYYKLAADGYYALRVDHPSDLIQVDLDHVHYPPEWQPRLVELDVPAKDLKESGNAAYIKKDYVKALDNYTKGIQACQSSGPIMSDLLRNRALVNLLLKRYEAAELDANASLPINLEDQDSAAKALHSKALCRAGQAAYALGKYRTAAEAYVGAQRVDPANAMAAQQLTRCLERLFEERNGKYDFEKMTKSTLPGLGARLDHASYIANTVVRPAGTRGRGLFAANVIKAGDPVLCEKAFCHATANVTEKSSSCYILININTMYGGFGAQASLVFSIVEHLRNNPQQAAKYLDLYDGGYSPRLAPKEVDGQVVIDTFRVQAIRQYSGFSGPAVSTEDALLSKRNEPKALREESKASGIWINASYINHDCIGNAWRAFIGDMMLVRATRDIAKDEEITMPYRFDIDDFQLSTEKLERTWGFKCNCTICAAEQTTTARQRKARQSVLVEVSEFLKSKPLTTIQNLGPTAISRATQLYKKLQTTYDEKEFNHVLRIGLVYLGVWLCAAYRAAVMLQRSVDAADRVLLHAGFVVSVKNGKLDVQRPNPLLRIEIIDACVYAGDNLRDLGNAALAAQYDDLARELYRTLHGGIGGFGKRYREAAVVVGGA